MNADHILHYTPSAEGFGSWRLECIHTDGRFGTYWEDLTWPDAERHLCACLAAGNDCRACREDDHGGCGFFGEYIGELGWSCRLRYDPNTCWAQYQFDELAGECMWGDDWPEDGPWPCYVSGTDYVELRYAAPPTHEEMEAMAKADDEFNDAMDS